jgi:hypothetical protein
MMNSILQIAQFAPPADALRMKRMLKECELAPDWWTPWAEGEVC